jgi:hypothetical protein
MKSARRRAFIDKKKKKEKSSHLIYKLFVPLIILVAIVFFIKVNMRVWDGQNKVAIVYKSESNDINVISLDPKFESITTLVIPADTEVDVSRNLGVMRIKNVWQLGINEKIGGKILPETVTRNFLFPVFLWADSGANGLASGEVSQIMRFMFIPKSTNIPFGDRVGIGIFAMKIRDYGRTNVDLAKNKFLDKKTLNDGQTGYVTSGITSERLTAYFSDNEAIGQDIKVNITDATGKSGISEKVGGIIEVIGGKVVSVDRKVQGEDNDCRVFGVNTVFVKKISELFSCKIVNDTTTFDLDIYLGQKFAKRF